MAMATVRLLVCALLVALVLVPLVGVATDDLSALTMHHGSGLQHQPGRGWRTMPAAVDPPARVLRSREVTTLESSESTAAPMPLLRPPFVPPRD